MDKRTDKPLRHAQPLQPDDIDTVRFRRQWALLEATDRAPAGWHTIHLNAAQTLHVHPDQKCRQFEAEAGESGVILLGIAVLTSPGAPLDCALAGLANATHDDLLALLIEVAGTYVVIRYNRGSTSIYTDPAAMMPVYYSGGRASSSPLLLPAVQRDPDIDCSYTLRGTDDWYTGSTTPYRGVRSLMANHALDLSTGNVVRFWPVRGPPAFTASDGIERACATLQHTMRSVVREHRVLMSLTGGRDSRVNLASSRDVVSEIEFFTIRSRTVRQCDLDYPRQLAARFGLDYRVVDDPGAPDWLVHLYDEVSGGLAIGGRREILGACAQLASRDYVHVNGNLGAITKSYYWHNSNPAVVKLSALAKEFVNRPPCIIDGLREWLRTVPQLPPTMLYNLMYLEQRGGRWMGVGESASSLFYSSFTPFCSRALFETVCGMPTKTQYGGTLLIDFVRSMWPDLLDVPYCNATRNWGTYLPKRWKNNVKWLLQRISTL